MEGETRLFVAAGGDWVEPGISVGVAWPVELRASSVPMR
jgi:hypothetical protein